MKPILEIRNLSVDTTDNKNILNNLNLVIDKNEPYILFGPNGAGKSTLLMAIAGLPSYKITGGKILFNGIEINNIGVDERSKLGIKTAFQLPPDIVGVKLRDVIKICVGKSQKDELSKQEMAMIEKFNLTDFLDRDINVNFSGGEKKRAEILQLILMKPKLMLIDEPDSGVDILTLQFIGKEINSYLKKTKSSALIITHQGSILNFIESKRACVLFNKRIECLGNPKHVLNDIKTRGYEGCKKCKVRGKL